MAAELLKLLPKVTEKPSGIFGGLFPSVAIVELEAVYGIGGIGLQCIAMGALGKQVFEVRRHGGALPIQGVQPAVLDPAILDTRPVFQRGEYFKGIGFQCNEEGGFRAPVAVWDSCFLQILYQGTVSGNSAEKSPSKSFKKVLISRTSSEDTGVQKLSISAMVNSGCN